MRGSTRLVGLAAAVAVLLAVAAMAQAALDTRVYYSFDEVVDADSSGGYTFNSTDYYADLSGNGHNALLKKDNTVTADNPIGATAKFGNSFRTAGRLNGGNNHTYTSTPHTADLNFTGNDDFSFSVWTYAHYENTSWGHRGYYFGKWDSNGFDLGGTSQGYAFSRRGGSSKKHRWTVNDSTAQEAHDLPHDGTDQWDKEEWALWTITFDGDAATDNLKAYVNGTLQMTKTLTTTNWANTEPFLIAGRRGEHQRSFVWPAKTTGDGFIDDFAALGDTLTGPEVLGLFNLAEHADLGYAFGDAEKLLSLHRDGAGSVDVAGLTWSYATGLTGNLGEVTGSGTDFELMLTDNGTGLTTAGGPVIPEPSTLVIWALGLLGLALYGWRRKRSA